MVRIVWQFVVVAALGLAVAASASAREPVAPFGQPLEVYGEPPAWIHWIQEESPACKTLLMWMSCAEPEGGPPGLDEPLASDRPDFTEASSTVGRGVLQIEMGYTYFRDDENGSRLTTHSYPEVLVRLGVLADWLELRLGWNYFDEEAVTGPLVQSASGSDDLYLGVKLGLTPQQGIWPEMALTPQMRTPLGSPFSAGEVLPGINWLYGWDINEWLSTAGSTQVNLAIDDATDDEYTAFAQSWTIGYTLAERLGAYTEWFVIAPAGAETALTEHYFDGGFTFRASNNLQFDVRAGVGASRASIDFFTGAGAVMRF
jgi:hypothetical protein